MTNEEWAALALRNLLARLIAQAMSQIQLQARRRS
jgi:hypothetical protein